MHQEHDLVVLTQPLSALGLQPGAMGVVVHVHGQGVAYEVEFMRDDGCTLGLETLRADQLRKATPALKNI